ncbi:MAG TPA: DUF1499 domain-containing protein [Gammaproteobacteria bacterium]|jgi:uncharacterized protein (DUF1499 family)|nr:DUF1499 domain-containing protein [Gammaproteobacteria bacterium]|tara:strand:+ start:6256 stop:7005 length:750 start_codon:yes stop_codon:yes gene_type:complete
MSEEVIKRRWWADALMIGGVIAISAAVLGGIGTRLGIWSFQGGFILLQVSAVLAVVVAFLGIIALIYGIIKGKTAERSALAIGIVLSSVVLAQLGLQFSKVQAVPPIHNISTDTQDPPVFDQIVAIREAVQSNPLAYNTAELAAVQQAAYPDVKTLVIQLEANAALAKAYQVLSDLGLDIVSTNPSLGIVEGTETTFWFGFKDDVVVRVREQTDGIGSIIDVRSVSRVGVSDLGVNAARIEKILAAMQN